MFNMFVAYRVLICSFLQEELEDTKGVVNQRKTDNTMIKKNTDNSTNNDLRNTKY